MHAEQVRDDDARQAHPEREQNADEPRRGDGAFEGLVDRNQKASDSGIEAEAPFGIVEVGDGIMGKELVREQEAVRGDCAEDHRTKRGHAPLIEVLRRLAGRGVGRGRQGGFRFSSVWHGESPVKMKARATFPALSDFGCLFVHENL